MALPIFIALALSATGFGQTSKQILERKTGDRFITLVDFPDGGLTKGPRDIHVFVPPVRKTLFMLTDFNSIFMPGELRLF